MPLRPEPWNDFPLKLKSNFEFVRVLVEMQVGVWQAFAAMDAPGAIWWLVPALGLACHLGPVAFGALGSGCHEYGEFARPGPGSFRVLSVIR